MHQRPVVGIPTQTLQSIDRIPEDLPESWVMNRRYFDACTQVGAIPWMVPLLDEDLETLRAIYERLDGLFIAGGVDMDPASYGCDRHDLCGRTDLPRDAVELMFARWALEDGKPILGVCRGMQVMAVATGGSLHQHLPDLLGHDRHRAAAGTDPMGADASAYGRHDVVVKPGSRAHALLGRRLTVNSFHHQGVDDPGEFLATGWCPDDRVLEIIEHPSLTFALGVQWHPERTGDLRVFAALNEAAARRSGLSRPALAA